MRRILCLTIACVSIMGCLYINAGAIGTKTEIKVGIAYVDFWGTDTFFASTKMGLSDEKLFTVTKTPGKNTKYYGCIDNNTGGKVYGSFSIYAVTA